MRPTAVDLAEGARRAVGLLDETQTPDQVCRDLGIGRALLNRRLRIALLPKTVRDLARDVRAPMRLLVDLSEGGEDAEAMLSRLGSWSDGRRKKEKGWRARSSRLRRADALSMRVLRAVYDYVLERERERQSALECETEAGTRSDASDVEAERLRAGDQGVLALARFLSGKTMHVSGAPGLARRIREALS